MKKEKIKNILNDIKKDIQKRKLFIGTISLLLIGVIGVTLAIMSSNGYFENILHSTDYGVNIEEEFYNNWGTKKVSFVNNNKASIILRVSYNELWSTVDEENTLTVLNNKVNNTDVVTKEWTNNWLNDFTDGHDGWYYYNKVLNSTEKVQVLNTITLNEELITNSGDLNTYKNANYELDFNFESTQASEKAVLDLWGKTITINNDGSITWNL